MTKTILIFISGLLLSLVLTTGIRFVTQKEAERVHYHADFMIHINGDMQMLDEDKYYPEESAECSIEEHASPEERAHLHDKVSTVVHVEDDAVTWGHFLQNLGYGLTGETLVDDKGNVYTSSKEKELRFILNGKEVENLQNRIIESKDRLLISYGPETAEELIRDKYNEVTQRAEEFNNTPDPESCSGGKKETFSRKLKRAFIN